jgi:Na+/H+-dicarboxylate symporter
MSRLILVGAVAGGFCGWYWGPQMTSVAFLGDLFLNALKMLVVPLIMASIIVGVTSLGDVRKLGGLGWKTLLYYSTTTGIAVLLGLLFVNLMEPGAGVAVKAVEGLVPAAKAMGFQDIVLSFVHPNVVQAMVDTKVLALIVFSIIFGGVLTTLGERARPFISLIQVFNDVIIKMVHLVLWLAPIGVFALVASRLGLSGGGEAFLAELMKIGKYALTVILSLATHGLIILPLILMLFTKINPWYYFKGMMEALVTAFSTASSSATLPVTLSCVKEKNKINEAAADFVLPIGATINMDGTALYEAVAAMFIAQAYGIDLSWQAQGIIFLTATFASIGAAGIPEAGLVTMVLVLQAVGLPLDGIGLLLAIDWFLDRIRTTVNVWGDSIGAAIIHHTKEIQFLQAASGK